MASTCHKALSLHLEIVGLFLSVPLDPYFKVGCFHRAPQFKQSSSTFEF